MNAAATPSPQGAPAANPRSNSIGLAAVLTACLPYLLGNNALPTAIGTAFAILIAIAALGGYLSAQPGRTATVGAAILLVGGLAGLALATWFGLGMAGIQGNPSFAHAAAMQGINVPSFAHTGTTAAVVFGVLSQALFTIGLVKLVRR